jgi:HPt (histidine-containing phosphotransfer) domain-containing protein
MMPEMDGVETVHHIRDMGGKYEKLIIVALTANAMKSARLMFFENKFNDFLAKPINSNELRKIVLTYLPYEKIIEDQSEGQSHSNEAELFRKVAVTFARDNRETMDKINNALTAGDLKTVHRIAHTLKSSAGYLGKTALQEAAASLEFSLQTEPYEYTDLQVKNIDRELTAALDEFAHFLAEAEAEKSKKTTQIGRVELMALLDEIKPLLVKSDFGASDYVERLQGIAGMEELAERIDNFDFDGALAELELHAYPLAAGEPKE